MKRLKQITIFVLALQICSCSNIPKEIKVALKLAGENRKELEKVITHYQKQGDSLKLNAACFLIANMPYHAYYEIENPEWYDNFFEHISAIQIKATSGDDVFDNELRGKAIDKYVEKYLSQGYVGSYRGELKPDIQSLNSGFLIENIDYAFKAWNLPWAKQYSFEEFCNYILPYRYGNEAPSKWRKAFFEKYKWVVDSVKNKQDVIEVCAFVNKLFRNKISYASSLKRLGNNIQPMHLETGMVVGSCEGQTGLGECILRAIGVPVSVISIPWWGIYSGGHETNAVLDSLKQWRDFAFDDLDPKPNGFLGCVAPKMYFKQFARVKQPQLEHQYCWKDVSKDYQKVQSIRLKLTGNRKISLCVFGDRGWAPVCSAGRDSSGVVFENVGIKNYMFIATVVENGQFTPLTYPFTTDSAGVPTYFHPDTLQKQSFIFDRKFPPYVRDDRCDALIGGAFQSSDNPGFVNPRTLYTIKNRLKYRENIFKISSVKSKYIRFVFPQKESEYNGPAEVSFYHLGKKLSGKYCGSPQLTSEQIHTLSDRDVLTYVEWRTNPRLYHTGTETGNIIIKKEKNDPVWIGEELDSVSEITHVGICPRNDKNNIYPGMYYELFYWDNQWVSLGTQRAKGETLVYDNIPKNAVLWLRNHTEGKEERIFTIENGKQVWW